MQWKSGLTRAAAPMLKPVLLSALLATAPFLASPAAAQDGTYRSRTVVVFGNDPCPQATNADEIIVCARRPEEERYRIPKRLREEEKAAEIAREDQVGANRAAIVSSKGIATGTGSCSAVGPGGFTGCNAGINVVGAVKAAVDGVETALEPDD